MRNWTPYRLAIHRLRSSGLRKTADEVLFLYQYSKNAEMILSYLAQMDTDQYVGMDEDELVTVTIPLAVLRNASKVVGTAPGSAPVRSDSLQT